MEMLEDVLLEEEEVMTEVMPPKKWFRREETIVLPDEFIQRKKELVQNRKAEDRWIPKGYMSIEESLLLCHEMIDDVRKILKQNGNSY
jgi:ribosomal protein S12 methylthiotransferase accessory factor YcaO